MRKLIVILLMLFLTFNLFSQTLPPDFIQVTGDDIRMGIMEDYKPAGLFPLTMAGCTFTGAGLYEFWKYFDDPIWHKQSLANGIVACTIGVGMLIVNWFVYDYQVKTYGI